MFRQSQRCPFQATSQEELVEHLKACRVRYDPESVPSACPYRGNIIAHMKCWEKHILLRNAPRRVLNPKIEYRHRRRPITPFDEDTFMLSDDPHFGMLPTEIVLDLIFCHFSGMELASLARVSRRWWALIANFRYRTQGRLATWGAIVDVTGHRTIHKEPCIVTATADALFTGVWAGTEANFALRADMTLLAWGENHYGKLGVGDSYPHGEPKPVIAPPPEAGRLVAVACGEVTTVGLTDEGYVFEWGRLDMYAPSRHCLERVAVPAPQGVPALADCFVTQIAAGTEHFAALDDQGSVYIWGNTSLGQAGRLVPSTVHQVPTLARLPGPAAFIACGAASTFLLLADGRLLIAGLRCCHMHRLTARERYVAVCAGATRALILTSRGRLFDLAESINQLDYERYGQARSRAITSLQHRGIVRIAMGPGQCFAVAADGQLFAWGNNTQHQLGFALRSEVGTPSPVAFGALRSQHVGTLACGLCHTIACLRLSPDELDAAAHL